ncbi:alpha/beta hydrolase [bacterium SCSIO 12643]|nr:alpha/beta hydrolase [bacterium SCSIO 12643]
MKFYYLLLLLGIYACNNDPLLQSGNFHTQIDSLDIHYVIKGIGPAMFVGHLNSGKIGYEKTLSELEDQFTMIYYDPRGTGKSEAPKHVTDYEYDHLIQEIDLLRQHLELDKIWIFGHSDQSEIAMEYAIEYPGHIQGLILSGTHFVEQNPSELYELREFENTRRQNQWFNQVVNDWEYRIEFQTLTDSNGRDLTYAPIKWWCYDSASAQKVIPIYNLISQTGRRKTINGQSPFSTSEERQKLFDRVHSYQNRYHEIQCPTFILQGEFDSNNPPKLAKKLDAQLPNSTLVLLPKSGHFPWVEQPEESFKAISNWLDTL